MSASWKESFAEWNRYWFSIGEPARVGTLRIGVCALVAIQFCASFLDGSAWFGMHGWIDPDTGRYLIGDGNDGTGSNYRWSLLYSFPGMTSTIAVLGLLASVAGILGVGSRLPVACAWIALSMLHHRGPMFTSIHEPLLSSLLAYLILDSGSVGWTVRPKVSDGEQRWSSNLVLRLIQCHFLIHIMWSVASMLSHPAWWNGEAGGVLLKRSMGVTGNEWQTAGQWLTHLVIGSQLATLFFVLQPKFRWLGRWMHALFVLCMLCLVQDWMYAAVLLTASLSVWPVRFTLWKVSNESQR